MPSEFWQTISKAKDYFACTSGALIYSIIPNILWENMTHINFPEINLVADKNQTERQKNMKLEKLVIQTNQANRLDFYKKTIRQNFALRKSVFLCLPTVHDFEYFQSGLQKGISEFVFTIDTDMPKKMFIEKMNNMLSIDHPILIISTPAHLYLASLIKSLDTIIIEKESSPTYRTISRPYIDMRVFAEILATETKKKIIFADTMLQIETIHRVQNKELNELLPISFRVGHEASKEIINLKEQWQKENKFFTLSKELEDRIRTVIENNKRIFIFNLRKGLANMTICNDCHTVLSCEHCNAPFTLYKTNSGERIFACNKCKNKRSANVKCEHCLGWNLVPMGIGLDRVYDEIREKFGNVKIFKMDKDSVKSHKEALRVVKEFYETPGSIMLGTEMSFYYLKSKIDYVAIVSFDALFSIPSFRINEKIINVLINIEDLATDKILIQTKNPDEFTLRQWYGNNLTQFYRQEIEDRERFFYPPFSTTIKITFQGTKESVEKTKEGIAELFKEYNPSIFFGAIPKSKSGLIMQTIIRVPKNTWVFKDDLVVDQNLLSKLLSLPPSFTVQINPESTN